MPSPTDILFELMTKRKFAEALEMLKSDSSLINAINPRSSGSILKLALIQGKSPEIVQYVLTHPDFNPQYADKQGLTNLGFLAQNGHLDLLVQLDKDQVITTQGGLTYSIAAKQLVIEKEILQDFISKDSPYIAIKQKTVTKLENTLSYIRDVTILHALATDDAKLMQQLKEAGANPTKPLGATGNNKLTSLLVKPQNIQIQAWYKIQAAEASVALSESSASFFKSQKQLQNAQDQVDAIEKKYLEKSMTSHVKAAKELIEVTTESTNAVKRK